MGLSRCREAQPTTWYKTIVLSLQEVFQSLAEEGGGVVDKTSPEWADLKVGRRRAWQSVVELVHSSLTGPGKALFSALQF